MKRSKGLIVAFSLGVISMSSCLLPQTATLGPITPTSRPPTATPQTLPCPTPEPPTPTPRPPAPTSTAPPKPARIQFEPGATSASVTGHVEGDSSRLYVLRALANQTMEVQATSTNDIQLEIQGADGTVLKSPADGEASWQGKLPSTQNYFISIISGEEETDYTLTVAIGPLGWEVHRDKMHRFEIWYPGDFAVDATCHPVAVRGEVPIDLRLTGSGYYSSTNLLNACVVVGVDRDEETLSTCLKPLDTIEETLDVEEINGFTFHKFSRTGVAAGNIYEESSYRAIHRDACYEIALLMHSGNIGAYPEDTVTEFDSEAVLERLKQVVQTFRFLE